MESFSFYTFSIVLFLCMFYQSSHCQQTYPKDLDISCTGNTSLSRGYFCNGTLHSCKSYATYRSQPYYNTAVRIASLLGSEASTIASINKLSNIVDEIPSDKLIMAPISCSCTAAIYQHSVPFRAMSGYSFLEIVNWTYQGLSSCQAMIGQNYYDADRIPSHVELMVPVRYACPSENQTSNGVISLLSYMVTTGDSVSSIAELFGVNEQNILSQDSRIYPLTPILIPLESKTCTTDPGSFFCDCPNGYATDRVSCKPDPKKFPVKWIALLGISLSQMDCSVSVSLIKTKNKNLKETNTFG